MYNYYKRFACCFAILLTHSLTFAAVINWNSSSGGSWFDPSKWTPATVPQVTDTVSITHSGLYTVSIDSHNVEIKRLILGAGTGVQVLQFAMSANRLTLNASSVINAGGRLNIGHGQVDLATTNSDLHNDGMVSIDSAGSITLNQQGDFTNDGTVTVNDSTSISGVTTGGGFFCSVTNNGTITKTGAGKLTLHCAFTQYGSGIFSLQNGSVDIWTFVAAGTVTLSTGTTTGILCDVGCGCLQLEMNGILDLQGTAALSGCGSVINAGQMMHSSSGTSVVSCNYDMEQYGGDLHVHDGKLAFTGPVFNTNGINEIGPTAELETNNAFFSSYSSVISTVADSGTLTLRGSGSITLEGAFSFSGNLRVLSGMAGFAPTTAIWIHSFSIEDSATFTCSSTVHVAVVDMNGGTTNSNVAVSGEYVWTAGSFTGGSGTSVSIDPGISLTIVGPAAKQLNIRDLYIDGTADISGSGALSLSSGASIFVNSAGTLDIGDSVTIIGPADSLVNSGLLNISSPLDTSVINTFLWNHPLGRTPGTIDILEGVTEVDGVSVNEGSIKVEPVAKIIFDNMCINANVLDLTNGSVCLVNASLINTATGIINLPGNTIINGGGIIINGGLVNKSGSGLRTPSRTSIATPFENLADSGLVDVMADTLILLNGGVNRGTITIRSGAVLRIEGTFVNEVGGTIQGEGVLDIRAAAFTNNGTLSPGTSPGTLVVSGDLNTQGVINIEVAGLMAGVQYDQLSVSGTAGLGGTLQLSRLNGFIPSLTDTFHFFNYEGYSGEFAAITGTPVGNGTFLEVAYRPSEIVQYVCNGVSGIDVSVAELRDTVRRDDKDTLEFEICNQGHCPLQWTSDFSTIPPGPGEWLSIIQGDTGLLTRGNCATIRVAIDAVDLWGGSYFGQIAISSNDPATPILTIPVNLVVPSNYDLGGGLRHYEDFGAVIADLEVRGVFEPTVFNVYPGLYLITSTIPAISGASAINTITFHNAGTPPSTPLFDGYYQSALILDNADHFVFDNINMSGGTNTIWLKNDADSNIIRNLTVSGLSLTNSTAIGVNIEGTGNDGNLVDGVTVLNDYTAIRLGGGLPAVLCLNNEVRNCIIPECAIGINVSRQNGRVHDNDIQPGYTGAGAVTVTGVMLSTQQAGDTARIYSNRIHNLRGQGAGAGISAAVSMTGLYKVYNNFIYDWHNSGVYGIYGIRANSGARLEIAFNSVRINDVAASVSTIAAIHVNNTATVVSASNNILQVDEPTNPCWSIYRANSSTLTSNRNCFFGTGAQYAVGYNDTASFATLAAWRTATGQDLQSKQGDPGFCGSTDLHIDRFLHFVDSAGASMVGITIDIDGESRTNPPDIGADEYVAINDRVDDLVIRLNSAANGIDLMWSAVPGANSYRIYKTDANDGNETPHILLATVGITSYTHSGTLLVDGAMQLRYHVVASSAVP